MTAEAGVVRPKDNDGTGSSSDTFQGGDQGVYVGRFSGGLGVGWEINPGDLDDDKHTADDKRGRDFLVLDFNDPVELSSLEFNYYGSYFYKTNSSYSYTTDHYVDVQVFTRIINNGDIEDTLVGEYRIDDDTDLVEFGGLIEGQTFVIAPSENRDEFHYYSKTYKEKYVYFKLRGVSGHTLENSGGGSVVPTPNAAIAALVALGMMGLNRRKRHG